MKETLEVVLIRMEELREDSKEFVLDSLRSTSVKLTVRDEALEALVTAMKEEIAELKGELTIYKAALRSGILASGPRQRHVDVSKPEKFKGTRSAREVDNFLWELEQYFRAIGIEDNATKVNTASIYFSDVALLWWRRWSTDEKCGGMTIETWEEFQRELKKQFYPQYTENELMLQISDLNEKEAFYWFEDGLKMWAKQELRRLGPKASQGKPWDRKGPLKYYLCQGPHRMSVCPKKAAFHAMEEQAEDDAKSLNSILGGAEDKASNGLMFVDIIVAGRGLNTLVDTGASDLFMSEKMAKELSLKIEKYSGQIKMVNSESIPITELHDDLLFKPTIYGANEKKEKHGGKTLSAVQFSKRVRQNEVFYLATLRDNVDEKSEGEIPKEVERLLKSFQDVMPVELPKRLPSKREVDHKFELFPNTEPPARAPYQIAPPELEELRNELMELLDTGLIRPSKAPFSVPVVPPSESSRRDEPKTACVTQYGSFKFLVMLFGLTNAPTMFCTLMNKVLQPFLDRFMVVYLDDIVVYSKMLEEHVGHLGEMFQTLLCQKGEMLICPTRSVILVHIVGGGTIKIDESKVQAIVNWELPTKVTELRSFLGLANYYRIEGYSKITIPLMDLLKKGKVWDWDPRCEKAFNQVKQVMMSEPVLALPDFSKAYEVCTDASEHAIGGVLMQGGHPITFEIRKLNETERRYTIQEKEMNAMVYWLLTWKHYLLGSRFIVFTDNVTNSYFLTQKKLSLKQARWQVFLAEFDFSMKYKLGSANTVVDALSRKIEFATISQPECPLLERI
ncbi:hypothetical protein CXB51_035290 [Gossypium anomalum]|uniref:Reverse transcriptase n=1 Tax=Gossypium anomalum TaxID=47600 RepID=A0A8J5Y176_9ROSI|nr:hypothetical protein CXB51_035290 [Gossypium anomalum]